MVTGRAASEAAVLSRDLPDLSVGLHWDVWGEDEREFDLGDRAAVREEVPASARALLCAHGTAADTRRLTPPRSLPQGLVPLFQELVEPLGMPLRGEGRVNFVGGFYAQ